MARIRLLAPTSLGALGAQALGWEGDVPDQLASELVGQGDAVWAGGRPNLWPGNPQMAAFETLIWRDWSQRRQSAAATTIALPSSVEGALWLPLNDGSGTTFVDRVQGLQATASGTTTNLWANVGAATMDANTAIVLRNSGVVDSIMRLDTLVGTLIVGLEVEGGNPGANCHAWGYGDNGNAAVGGYSGVIGTAGTITTWYGVVGGATNVAPPFALQALMLTKTRRFHVWAIHRGLHDDPSQSTPTIYADGIESDWHSRSARYRSLEAGFVGAASAQGLRIGARPTGTGGGSANHVGAQITLPRLRNFLAVRLRGDQRHNLGRIVADMARTVSVGVVPRILSGGF